MFKACYSKYITKLFCATLPLSLPKVIDLSPSPQRFAEVSSGDESVEDITETSEVKNEIADPECSKAKYPSENIL